MLESASFIKWAEKNVVVLIAHNELGHEPIVEKGRDGEETSRCPLYPGLTCRQHIDIAVDIDTARDEDLVKVPFQELHPNTWLVLPTGTVEQVPEEDQFVAKKIQERAAAAQKELGKPLGRESCEKIRALLVQAETATDEERWHDALTALAGVREHAPKPSVPLDALVDSRLGRIDEDVTYQFEDVRDDDDRTPAERREAIAALARAVDVDVFGRRLTACGAMDAWLRRNQTTGR